MNILLICSAGMSTSLLVTKMEAEATRQGIEARIWALGATEAKRKLGEADIVLLGPQVRFMKNEIIKLTKVPVEVIDMRAYGAMNGEKVLKDALNALELQK